MAEFQAMMDAVRDGRANPVASEIPSDLKERSNHLKAFAYFNDIAMVGVAPLSADDHFANLRLNPEVARLTHAQSTR